MPNWCHNTVTVEGSEADVMAFALAAQNDEQPLTFNAHVPEPSQDVYEAMEQDSAVRCNLCGGTGTRPTTASEASSIGAEFQPAWEEFDFLQKARELAVADRPKCNGCSGSGRYNPTPAWYSWHTENWGTKWDATFDGPFMALATDSAASVSGSVASNGLALVPGMAVYRFDTAWGPPDAWLERVAKACPKLTFTLRYGEPGNDFAGQVVAEHGEVTSNVALPIDDVLDSGEMWF